MGQRHNSECPACQGTTRATGKLPRKGWLQLTGNPLDPERAFRFFETRTDPGDKAFGPIEIFVAGTVFNPAFALRECSENQGPIGLVLAPGHGPATLDRIGRLGEADHLSV